MRAFFIEQMARYASYHRDRRNQLTHHLGVPAIVFSLLVLASLVKLVAFAGFVLTLAAPLLVLLIAFYLGAAPLVGFAAALLYGGLLVLAHWVAMQGTATALAVFGACFVGGWTLQLVGHVFEGRRPALADNLLQIFLAPSFLIAELLFALGLERDLHDRIEARWQRYREAS